MKNPYEDVPSVPHLVHIETTYACNQRCLFCYNPNRKVKIDFALLDRIVQVVYESWIPHVYLIGGEPSLLGTERLNRYIDLLSERSSVTIVTNGQILLRGLSSKLACIGVPMHGNELTHDFLAHKKGSYRTAVQSIREYVRRGFDVRCIPVLTAQNHNQMYDVIRTAKELGMESVFVDRFEDGGLGNRNSQTLKPSSEQFGIALAQMIQGRDDFSMPVGWGTAIPFCLDKRMLQANMTCNCGAGITFAAINPKGDVRICNQSERVYGNVLQESIASIWHKPEMQEFRALNWISPACRDCAALAACTGGCKVDTNHSDMFCVDYSVRGKEQPIYDLPPATTPDVKIPVRMRTFRPTRYLRLSEAHRESYLITRYQTVEVDETAARMVRQILGGVTKEEDLVRTNQESVENEDVRRFVSQLLLIDAIELEDGDS